jgi:hypothetical protein
MPTSIEVHPAPAPEAAALLRALLTTSVVSAHTARAYAKALSDFLSTVDLRTRPMARTTLIGAPRSHDC